MSSLQGAEQITEKYKRWAFVAGVIPVPFADFAAFSGVNLKMLSDLSDHYGVEFSESRARNILSALLGGAVPTVVAAGTVGSAIKSLPGVGSVLGAFTMPVFGAAATTALGKIFVRHFEEGGTLEDLEPEAVKESLRDELKEAVEEATSEEAVTEETPVEKIPAELEKAVEEASAEAAPVEEASAEATPAELEKAVEAASAEEASAEAVPVEEASVEEAEEAEEALETEQAPTEAEAIEETEDQDDGRGDRPLRVNLVASPLEEAGGEAEDAAAEAAPDRGWNWVFKREASRDEEALHEEARRLARLLVTEIKLYNEEVVEKSRRSGDIYDRLRDEIDRSRQMYEERIDPHLLGDGPDYFRQELIQRLAGGDERLLGDHVLIGNLPAEAAPAEAAPAEEASAEAADTATGQPGEATPEEVAPAELEEAIEEAEKVEEIQSEEAEEAESAGHGGSRSLTILIADDRVTVRKVVQLTFIDDDYRIIEAGNGKEALEKMAVERPDLVIADVHMPGASGYEVCRQAKQLFAGIPVLLLVGAFESFDQQRADAAGADSHLKKPFETQDLLDQVDALISKLPVEAAPADPETHAGKAELTSIKGIGPKLQGILKAEGIETLDQLAVAEVSELEAILEKHKLASPLRNPADWRARAQAALGEVSDDIASTSPLEDAGGEAEEVSHGGPRARTILLADENPTIHRVVEVALSEHDYEVISVSDGEGALEKLAVERPALVIADVHMPGADGYEVCRQAKQLHAGITVLLLVGAFERFDQQQADAAGADSHLIKPFDPRDFPNLVERLIGASPAEEAPDEVAPADREADVGKAELTRIKGIGPKLQGILKAEGIETLDQLAVAEVSELEAILEKHRMASALHNPADWPARAKAAL